MKQDILIAFNIMQNLYFCPIAFCYDCQIPFSTLEEAREHEAKTKHKVYFSYPNENRTDANDPYIGLYRGKFAKDCVACCFKSRTGPKKFRNCVSETEPFRPRKSGIILSHSG